MIEFTTGSEEARRQLAHAYLAQLVAEVTAGLRARYDLVWTDRRDSGWDARIARQGLRRPVVVNVRGEGPAYRRSSSLGFSYRPSVDADAALSDRTARALCDAFAKRDLSPPPGLLIVEGQGVPIRERRVEALELPSLCDRGCLFCGSNYLRVGDSAALSFAETHRRNRTAGQFDAAARGVWPVISGRIAALAPVADQTVIHWGGTDALSSPIFEAALEQASRLGFRDMSVQAPGTQLADPSYVAGLRDRGVGSVALTAHADSAGLFDSIGGRPGAHGLFWSALGNALAAGMAAKVEVPCLARNADELPALVSRLSKLPIVVSLFYWLADRGFDDAYDYLPFGLSEMSRLLAEVARVIPTGRVQVKGVPPCAIPPRHADHFEWIGARDHVRELTFGHATSCECCLAREGCLGMPRPFLARQSLPSAITDASDRRLRNLAR